MKILFAAGYVSALVGSFTFLRIFMDTLAIYQILNKLLRCRVFSTSTKMYKVAILSTDAGYISAAFQKFPNLSQLDPSPL